MLGARFRSPEIIVPSSRCIDYHASKLAEGTINLPITGPASDGDRSLEGGKGYK